MDLSQLGRLIAEEIINEPGPCLYPGKFKPPHKGHFKVAYELASRNYITEVIIIISTKELDGITPEESLQIWNMYLQALPNPKIKVQLSTKDSPIQDVIEYITKHPDTSPIYIVGGEDESDDQGYLTSVTDTYPNQVKKINADEKSEGVTSVFCRGCLKTGDYEAFVNCIPEAAFNKGAGPKVFKMLATNYTDDEREG
jgi:hypothetical protein